MRFGSHLNVSVSTCGSHASVPLGRSQWGVQIKRANYTQEKTAAAVNSFLTVYSQTVTVYSQKTIYCVNIQQIKSSVH